MMRSRKTIHGLTSETPVSIAAARAVRDRLDTVANLLPLAAAQDDENVHHVHQLRVATRRAGAALIVFGERLNGPETRKAAKRLKRIRKAAGVARDCDVHLTLLRDLLEECPECAPAIEAVIALTEAERDAAEHGVAIAARKHSPKKLRRIRRRLVESVRDSTRERRESGEPEPALLDLAQEQVPILISTAVAASERDLRDFEALHDLRIALKRLRYAVEALAPAFEKEARTTLLARLKEVQDRLGAINDCDAIIDRLTRSEQALRADAGDDQPAQEVLNGVSRLVRRFENERAHRQDEFLAWWTVFDRGELLAALDRLLATPDTVEGAPTSPAATAPAPVDQPPNDPSSSGNGPRRNGSVSVSEEQRQTKPGARRLAAIDVGTNSIRLIIAEASPDRSYRILDDEKETSRLGQGLATTGRMSPEAMERSAQFIEKMKGIAEGHGAEMIRVVGTAAVREAENRDEFLALVRERTGLEIQVISPEEEATLAHLSASRAFDLRDTTAAIFDIGGGSMEVVLSSSGVVDQVYTLPLGAVRLTEMFGGPEDAAGLSYKRMRRHIEHELERVIGQPPFTPLLLIGAGGTLTTLASVSLHRRGGDHDAAFAPATIRGHEMLRSEIKHILDRLRKTPLRQRADVPGLPPERADIIVAGLTAAERLMKHLGANSLRVHDRGIRDGMLLTMVREMFPSAAPDGQDEPDRMASIRRFAGTCDYDARHCDHVARLALRIFDQLAAQIDAGEEWAGDRSRALLEAAALLHDVGYHINYTKHHLHSFHLIMHADLRGFTPREIEIIANIARYHRKADPKTKHKAFARLKNSDRRLVRRLTAILRVAVGLDRTHMQNVRDVELHVAGGDARFVIRSPEEPGVDIWGAARKQDLFEKAFGLKPVFEWRPSLTGDVVPSSAPAANGQSAPASPPLRRTATAAETSHTA